jgi:hypothetical protein
MSWNIDERFRIPANKEILAFLERTHPSAHSDIASALLASAKGLGGVRNYCPDIHAYAWMALHTTDQRIFALALGMNTLAFRLPPDVSQEAIRSGGEAAPEIGNGWVRFQFGWNADLSRWCKTALEYAGQLKDD